METLTKEQRDFLSNLPDHLGGFATKVAVQTIDNLSEGHNRLTLRLNSAEKELIRLGYGQEVIDVLTEKGTGFTSHRGDLAWDTAENRARVRERYHAQEAKIAEETARRVDAELEVEELQLQMAKDRAIRRELAVDRAIRRELAVYYNTAGCYAQPSAELVLNRIRYIIGAE